MKERNKMETASEKKQLTKRQQEIISVSIELIAQGGIQHLTIKNISTAMSISEPAIYRHFESKLTILSAILDEFEQSSIADFKKIEAIGTDNRLKNFFIQKCSSFTQRPQITRVIFSEEIFQNEKMLSDKVAAIMKVNQQQIVRLVNDAQTAKECKDGVCAEHISLMIMGTLRLLVTRWRLSNFQFDLVAEAENIWDSIDKLIKC